MSVVSGQAAPVFSLPDERGTLHHLADYRGTIVVLYFYPKDNTPGCTLQAQQFAAFHAAIAAAGGTVIGISRDSQASHDKFKAKLSLPFTLLSDEDGAVCHLYDVIKEKNMYGKKTLGIERSTFLIDKEGIVRQIHRKVKADGHAGEMAEAVKSLAAAP